MKLSFSKKIFGLLIGIVLVVSGSVLGTTHYLVSLVSKNSEAQLLKEVDIFAESVQASLDDYKEKLSSVAYLLASREDVASAIKKKDTPFLQKIGEEIAKKTDLQVITIADRGGDVVARGHSKKIGDNVANQINVQKALAGEHSTAIEEGTVVKFSLRAGYPVKLGDAVVGSITTGIDLSSDDKFVDSMKKNFGIDCTIFHNDVQVSTTLFRDGKRTTGTKEDNPEVIEKVLKKGERVSKMSLIIGKDYATVYWPIVCADGKVGGMFSVGRDRSSSNQVFTKLESSIGVMTLVIVGLITAAGFFIVRSVVKPINRVIEGLTEGADQVASASRQVSSASQSLAEGASKQATGIEETSSSLEEMSSMTKQNAENANQANALMAETSRVAGEANHSMKELTQSMNEISAASEETSKIIKTIDEIAFQTNLLALNAAVEAARAGEAGAGFAVVADEVRNLATRAADAAKNTANLIDGTVKKIKNGSGIVSRTNEAFSNVATGAKKVSELVSEIASASQEQSQGIEQVNKAVSEMDEVVQKNSANAEESASASEEMSAQAEQMKEFVQELVAMVSGRNGNGVVSTKVIDRLGKGGSHVLATDRQPKGVVKGIGEKVHAGQIKKDRQTKVSIPRPKGVKRDQAISMEEGDFKEF